MSQDDDFFTQLGIEPREPKRITGRRLDAARARRREERARRRRRRRRRLVTTLVLVLVLSAVGGVGWAAYKHTGIENFVTAPKDYEGAGEDEVTVVIPDGAVGKDIAQILVDADVVATARAFLEALDDNPNAINIQPGTYTMRRHMSAANAVALLLDPRSKEEHTLTVTEGATKTQVKERLVNVGHFTEAQVDEAFKDTKGIGLPDVAGGDVEGWLAPGTYDVGNDATATSVVASMVSSPVARLNGLTVSQADYQTVLITASIVEREGTSDYYRTVSYTHLTLPTNSRV